METFLLRGYDIESQEKKFEMQLPLSRKLVIVHYQEDEVEMKRRNFLLRHAVKMRNNVHSKRTNNSTLLENRNYDLIDCNNEFRQILARHPFPFLQGPLIPQLDNSFNQDILNFKTTFLHSDSQGCGTWKPLKSSLEGWGIANLPAEKFSESFQILKGQEEDISGPACSKEDRQLIYTCQFQRCRILCSCKICLEPIKNIAYSIAQCQEHKITIPWSFDPKEHNFTMIASTESHFHFANPYAGIPLSCQLCSDDVLQHQILHLALHWNCKFCRQDIRPANSLSVVTISDFKREEYKMIKVEEKTCSICLKVCIDKLARKKHEKRSHGNHECQKCKKFFTSIKLLQHHRPCNSISSSIDRNKDQDHKKNESKFECEKCGYTFQKRFSLYRHEKEVHKTTRLNLDYAQMDDLMYQCQKCDAAFMRNSNLRRHMDSAHTDLKGFTCHGCGKKSNRKDNHNRHVKTCPYT